jgi:hypothetical protein
MSPDTHPLTWSELDRLADYTAGALDPVDAAEVARLVQTDGRWAAALDALMRADAAVRADLAVAAAAPMPVPEDVILRLDAALSGAPGASVISLAEARVTYQSKPVSKPVSKARQSNRQRRMAIAGFAAAAAAFVAIAGGLVFNSQLTTGTTSTAIAPAQGEADRNGGAAPPAAALPSPGFDSALGSGPTVLVSGTDYRLDTLRDMSRQPAPAPTDKSRPSSSSAPLGAAAQEAPSALARLTTPAGLDECLRAVIARYPGTAVLVDYARFDGEPALVIVVRQGVASMVIAVGSNCGAAGTDEKAAVAGA